MATIHHATIKAAAAKHGVTLTLEGDTIACAAYGERIFRVDADEDTNAAVTEAAKDALCLAVDVRAFEADHPTIQIEQEDDDFVAVLVADGSEIARDPDFEDLIVTLNEAIEAGTLEADEAEEDEPEVRSVVPYAYKREYAERGHPAHCGDWLAVTLNGFCLDATGFQIPTMVAICEANALNPEKWLRSGTRGWQGRFRMTSRNALAKIVAAAGVMHVPAEASNGQGDLELAPPASWVAEHTPKGKGKAAVAA